MTSRPIPPELNQPVPRRVKTNIWFKLTAALLLIFPGAGLLMLAVIWGAFHEKAMLKANGIPTTAQITDLHIESGASKYYAARYRFRASATPDGKPHVQSGEGQMSESQYHSLQVGQAVPVLYDPAHPANSGLNIDDSLRTSDPYATMPLLMTIVVGLFGGIFALLTAGLLFLYFREKKFVQWGRVAPAILLKEEEIGGLHPRMTATYQFTDERGRTLVRVQKNLPSVKKLDWPGFSEFRRNVTETPIVLYDPQNSEQNMLYRAGFLTAVLP